MFTPGGQLDLLSFAGLRKGGKGGGSYTPPPPVVLTDPVSGKSFTQTQDMWGNLTGTSAQDQLNAYIDQRKAQEKSDSDAATLKKQQDDAAALDKFNTNKSTAYNDALNNVMRTFNLQGVDPNQYLESDIKPLLNARQNTIRDLDPNPGAAYGSDLGNTILNNLTSGRRTGASSALDAVFTPNYSSSMLADTLPSGYANTILDEQFNPLSAQLQNAQKRGTLTDVGYQAALGKLAEKRAAGASTINDLGRTILGRERGEVDEYISKARSDANALNLNTTFDPNSYFSGAKNLVQGDIDTFGGALRSAVGGTKFADLSELINAGGAVQGANNPTPANPNAPGAPVAVPDDPNTKRGLGSTGAF